MRYICLQCHDEFEGRKQDRRKFCSQSCAAIFNNTGRIKVPKQPCAAGCGKIINPSKQTYCSVVCRRVALLLRWMDGETHSEWSQLPQMVREFLYQERGRKCEICGWCEVNPTSGLIPVEIDHIDGNSRNNAIENLKILCPNHHALTPTYRSLNKVGRKRNK